MKRAHSDPRHCNGPECLRVDEGQLVCCCGSHTTGVECLGCDAVADDELRAEYGDDPRLKGSVPSKCKVRSQS